MLSEGGMKFHALRYNRNVCIAIFDPFEGFGSLGGMQVTGIAEFPEPFCDEYDRLLEQFGTPAPAVGVVAVIDQLMNALARQKISQPLPSNHCMIIYENEKLEEAIRRASELRSRGIDVELVRITPERTREDCRAYAKAEDCMLVVEL